MAEESLCHLGEEFRGRPLRILLAGLKRAMSALRLWEPRQLTRRGDMGSSLTCFRLRAGDLSGRVCRISGSSRNASKTLKEMLATRDKLGALLIVGANPVPKLKAGAETFFGTFVIVQDLFLTETAAAADVVFPAASLYEKSGTVTNTFAICSL